MVLRALMDSDIDVLSGFIYSTWEMDCYGEGIAMPASGAYLSSCIRRSDYIRVLEEDGLVVGCIMVGESKPCPRISSIIDCFQFTRELGDLPGFDGFMEDMEIIDGTDAILHDGCDIGFDSEIVLLLVSESHRGKGFGRILMGCAMDHLRSRSLHSTLVFTDDDCGYGFYDAIGGRCLAAREVDLLHERLRMMAYVIIA